jgi:hypothetical protein
LCQNHPSRNAVKEIDWIGRHGSDFVDLTLEPPADAEGSSWRRGYDGAISLEVSSPLKGYLLLSGDLLRR